MYVPFEGHLGFVGEHLLQAAAHLFMETRLLGQQTARHFAVRKAAW